MLNAVAHCHMRWNCHLKILFSIEITPRKQIPAFGENFLHRFETVKTKLEFQNGFRAAVINKNFGIFHGTYFLKRPRKVQGMVEL